MSDTETDSKTQRIIQLHMENNIPTCIIKTDGTYFHGIIISIELDSIILQDRFNGNMPIFFSDIQDVQISKQLNKENSR